MIARRPIRGAVKSSANLRPSRTVNARTRTTTRRRIIIGASIRCLTSKAGIALAASISGRTDITGRCWDVDLRVFRRCWKHKGQGHRGSI
jgi:hypothetical protein